MGRAWRINVPDVPERQGWGTLIRHGLSYVPDARGRET
jgi:hypothetical protein